jgi:hypothetical protein
MGIGYCRSSAISSFHISPNTSDQFSPSAQHKFALNNPTYNTSSLLQTRSWTRNNVYPAKQPREYVQYSQSLRSTQFPIRPYPGSTGVAAGYHGAGRARTDMQDSVGRCLG